jgi:flagellar biosynthesis chaperone FliJ
MAIAFIRPEIGYCQGMNFIVGALINFIDSEEKCFWIFLHFIDNIELKMLYLQNGPDYLIKLYQLNNLVKEKYPKLLPHLKANQINPDIFFSKWILTLFSNFLPFKTLYNIWDLFILDKWKAIFKFSIIIINYMKDELMNLDLYSFSPYLKNNANINLIEFADLSKLYNNYKITNKKLFELKEDFFVEELKTKLEIDNNLDLVNDKNGYVSNYQSELNNFINSLKKPVEKLQQQISKINLECEEKLKKYDKKLSEVNNLKAKIEKEIEIKMEYENTLKQYIPEMITEPNTKILHNNTNYNNIYTISNKKNLTKKEKAASPKNNNYKNSETQKYKKAESARKRKFHFNLKYIINKDSNEYDKILKKLNTLNKEIDKNNKNLVIECQKLDKKQISYEKVVYKRDELKKQLDIILRTSELTKRELIRNLSLKLNGTSSNNNLV